MRSAPLYPGFLDRRVAFPFERRLDECIVLRVSDLVGLTDALFQGLRLAILDDCQSAMLKVVGCRYRVDDIFETRVGERVSISAAATAEHEVGIRLDQSFAIAQTSCLQAMDVCGYLLIVLRRPDESTTLNGHSSTSVQGRKLLAPLLQRNIHISLPVILRCLGIDA